MNSLWKIARTLMAIIGCFLLLGAVGTSDYYLLELGKPEPSSVLPTIIIGAFLTLPTVITLIYRSAKGDHDGF